MDEKQNRKKLRGYLKGYQGWLAQAGEIERALASKDGVPESLRELLTKAKNDFVVKCRHVQIILGYTKAEGLERRIMNSLYISGKNMRQVAREVGYSYGYCANIELKAITRMSRDARIMWFVQ